MSIPGFLSRPSRLRTSLLAFILLGIGALLLFPSLGIPQGIVFDEAYMIPRGQKYINGIFFQECHPPLGRLLIALGQFILHPDAPSDRFAYVDQVNGDWPAGEDLRGYRLFPAIFGMLIPAIAFLILVVITRDDWLSFFAGFALVFDNALLAQSHSALTDPFLIGFCLLFVLCLAWLYMRSGVPDRRDWLGWCLLGAALGAAAAVKLTGLFLVVAIPFYLWRFVREKAWRQIVAFAGWAALGFVIVTVLIWQVHFSLLRTFVPDDTFRLSQVHRDILEGRSNPDPVTRLAVQMVDSYYYILTYHENVPPLRLRMVGEIGSPWYMWPLGGRAIPYRWELGSGSFRAIYLIGNPVTWLFSLLGVLGGLVMALVDLKLRFLAPERRAWLWVFLSLYVAYMLPISLISRVLYLYHYLPPMVLGVILFALCVREIRLAPRTRRELAIFLAVWVLIAFWVYSPFQYYLPMTRHQFEQRNIWPVWDLECIGCEQLIR
jgi:dolichyl-phosphate-mannose--protein O-mannosyl transferase